MRGWAALVASALAAAAVAGEFRLYPGAVKYTPPDTDETRQFMSALRPGTTITAYFSEDSFEKVVDFYRGFAREYTNPQAPANRKLPSGEEIRKTFLILDGARDVATSRSWVSIQRPFIGRVSMKGDTPEYQDVRDVTEIVLTEKKQVPKEEKK